MDGKLVETCVPVSQSAKWPYQREQMPLQFLDLRVPPPNLYRKPFHRLRQLRLVTAPVRSLLLSQKQNRRVGGDLSQTNHQVKPRTLYISTNWVFCTGVAGGGEGGYLGVSTAAFLGMKFSQIGRKLLTFRTKNNVKQSRLLKRQVSTKSSRPAAVAAAAAVTKKTWLAGVSCNRLD